MKSKCSVTFRLETRIDKETGQLITENVPIIMDFTFDSKRMKYFTGHRIDTLKWNREDQEVKKNNINKAGITASDINYSLSVLKSTITEAYKEAKFFKKNPSVQYLRDDLRKRLNEENSVEKSFFNVFDEFVDSESKKNDWTAGTKTKFETNRKHLLEFQTSKRYKIEFDSIDEKFFIKYIDYQRTDLDHRNTTIAKNLKIFRWFMNWATRKGYNKNLAYKDYSPDLKGITRNNKIIYLTWDELMFLYQKPLKKRYLAQVRDVFCFSCFTGLRYSDVYNLKRSNVKEDFIEFTSVKTDESLIIDLNDYSKAILDKYKNTEFENNKCLPVISNQKMNVYLKELGKAAKFEDEETVVWYKGAERFEKTYKKHELLTTHVGRKTFVTNAIFLNIPSEVIQKWTGHKDHKMLEKYYKIVDQQRRVEMQKFNKKSDE
jgi:integrase